MKIVFSLLALLTSLTSAFAQNLVPNPSFEEYEECPFSTAELALQTNWVSWQESPDYFNECNNSINGFAGVPSNSWGYQEPITGNSYMALVNYANYAPNIREYAAVELNEPLIIGQVYRVLFHASLYDGGVKSDSRCATNHIGLRFFKDPTYNNTTNPLLPDNFAHLDYNLVMVNSESWTLTESWFTANDNYNWLAIGNFFDDENTTVEILNAPENCVSIYYIENICVSASVEDCDALLFVDDRTNASQIKIRPNPFSEAFTLQNDRHNKLTINIYNGIGDMMAAIQTIDSSVKFDTSIWPSGLYLIRTKDENQITKTFKIIKQ